jgi:hypothetical protein
MATWKITVSGKGLRKASIEKLVAKLGDDLSGASVAVVDATPPESRAARFAAAQALASDAKDEFQQLLDELQEWLDNLPESFQQGEKGETLQTAIDSLEELLGHCEEVEGVSVDFPGMYN